MGITVIHAGINLRIVFRFGDVHLFALLVEFPHGFTDGRVPGDGAVDGFAKLQRAGGSLADDRRHAAIQRGEFLRFTELSGIDHRRRRRGEGGHRYQAAREPPVRHLHSHVLSLIKMYCFIVYARALCARVIVQVLSGNDVLLVH